MTQAPVAAPARVEAPAARPTLEAPDLTVVVVGYNSGDVLDACFRSLPAGAPGRQLEVVLVDNASTDGSVARVRQAYPFVRILEMGRNAGFAAAVNRGIAEARGRFVMLLNPDTEVTPGALARMLAYAESAPDAGIVAPRLLNADLTDQRTARRFPTPAAAIWGRRSPLTRLFPGNPWSRRYLNAARTDGAEPFDVDWVSGACMLVSRPALAAVGGLDERFFMYWEDADWCRRMHDAGLRVVCVPEARVVHEEGATRRGWPARQVWRFHRSAARYYAKHHLKGPRRVLVPAAAGALYTRAAAVAAWESLRRGRGAQRSTSAGRSR